MVVLDTDILITLSKGDKSVVEKVKNLESTDALAVTVFNLEEYLYGLQKFGNEKEIELGKKFISRFHVYEYQKERVDSIIKIRLDLEKQGSPIGKYDECIAGLCLANNETLYTLNRKHFEKVKELKLV